MGKRKHAVAVGSLEASGRNLQSVDADFRGEGGSTAEQDGVQKSAGETESPGAEGEKGGSGVHHRGAAGHPGAFSRLAPRQVIHESQYELRHALRCHSSAELGRDDAETRVWSVAARPQVDGGSVAMVAAGGGNAVVVIDCPSGIVEYKYTEMEGEDFYALAWRDEGVLAAAGAMGDIKMLDIRQHVCYELLMGHSASIYSLAFAPHDRSLMASAGADGIVCLWRTSTAADERTMVDPATGEEVRHRRRSERLAVYHAHRAAINCVAFTPDAASILTCCDDHTMALWPVYPNDSGLEVETAQATYRDPFHSSNVDCGRFVTESIVVSKGACEADIMIWNKDSINRLDLSQVRRLVRAHAPGTPESEIETKYREQHILGSLSTEETDELFIKFDVATNLATLAIGTSDGRVLLHDLAGTVRAAEARRMGDQLPEDIAPRRILTPPDRFRSTVRGVAMSDDGEYVVAVTDANIVLIYHIVYAEPNEQS